jgi:GTP pyrophosphokinase
MDEIAENGIASHWSYKENGSNKKASIKNEMEQKLQFFKSMIELKNSDNTDEDIVNSLKENILIKSIYVFTPMGDVVELANGSTPIDFAYKVHTNVGNKMIGALVNGNMVPLDYKLKNNDVVKIKTSNSSNGPSKEWLNIAYTTQAKNKIKSFYNKMEKTEYLKRGEEMLKDELRKRKIPFNDFINTENIDKILSEYKYNDLNSLYTNIGSGKLPLGAIFNFVYGENSSKQDLILQKAQNNHVKAPTVKNDIIVEGADDIKVNVASCCKPIVGDKIIGYITKGHGINVHRIICPNIKDIDVRTIDVRWNDEVTKKYPTSIIVHATSNKDLLLNIITKTSNTDITIQSINSINSNHNYMFEITVLVANKDRLQKFMDDLLLIPDVLDVERTIK